MRRFWTAEEIELLQYCYEDTPTAELAELLGVPASRVYAKANVLCLRKSQEFLAEQARQKMLDPNHPARRCQFQKGIVPANKGVKRGIYPSKPAADLAVELALGLAEKGKP
jgi:hypothetical protein